MGWGMKHSEQVLKLLRKQIGNDSEVQDIQRTAQDVVKKWINPLSCTRFRRH
jgi:hypothetical protein